MHTLITGGTGFSVNATLDLLMQVIGQRRPVLHLPVGPMNAVAAMLERLPNPPLPRGLIAFSRVDNTGEGAGAAEALGLTFRGVDAGVREVYGSAQGGKTR